MNLIAKSFSRKLIFKKSRGTSRGILNSKLSVFVFLKDKSNPYKIGVGECSYLDGLSPENKSNYEKTIIDICNNIQDYNPENLVLKLRDMPSILFGFEMAFRDLFSKYNNRILFENEFSKGNKKMKFNGLVWMNNFEDMKNEAIQKINDGFSSIKFKIGAIDTNKELELIKYIREYAPNIEIRLDANGAFDPKKALSIIEKFAKHNIHSLEQPIKAGNYNKLYNIIQNSAVKIALDEEIIGKNTKESKIEILEKLKPDFIILKPSLVGGFQQCSDWITLCEKYETKWWFTSALESNIGLNAIVQFAAEFDNNISQGFGTGNLYFNNLPSNLMTKSQYIYIKKYNYPILKS